MAMEPETFKNLLTGPGEHGRIVFVRDTLSSGVAKRFYFGGLRFVNADRVNNVAIFISDDSTSAGTPTIAWAADGSYVDITRATGGTFKAAIIGDLARLRG